MIANDRLNQLSINTLTRLTAVIMTEMDELRDRAVDYVEDKHYNELMETAQELACLDKDLSIVRAEVVDRGKAIEEEPQEFHDPHSSSIDTVKWSRGTLEVTFKSGNTYRYTEIPWNIYIGLRGSNSRGRYYNTHIRGLYQGTLIDGESQ